MAPEFDFETMPFFFLRHGQTDDNRENLVMGQLDPPLNEHGIRQANIAAQTLAGQDIAAIYSSTLQRAMATARIVGEVIGVSVQAVPDLMERNFGLYQGRDRGERESGKIPKPDGVEEWQAFMRRTRAALKSIPGPSPVLVVAHSGTFRAVLGDKTARVKNATPLRLVPPENEGSPWSVFPVGE